MAKKNTKTDPTPTQPSQPPQEPAVTSDVTAAPVVPVLGQSDEGTGPVAGEPVVLNLVTDDPLEGEGLAGTGEAIQITDPAAYPDGVPPPVKREFLLAPIVVPYRKTTEGYAARDMSIDGEDALTLRDIAAGMAAAGMTYRGAPIDRPKLALSQLLEMIRNG